MPKNNAMTPEAASRIQSTQAKSGGNMGSDGFAARAQAAGARNENTGSSKPGQGRSDKTGAGQGQKDGGKGQK